MSGFGNQMMPINNMGVPQQPGMVGYNQNMSQQQQPQQQQNMPMMDTAAGMHSPLPMGMMPQAMQHQQQQQQQQMNNNVGPNNNNGSQMSLQTPTQPTAPMVGQQQQAQATVPGMGQQAPQQQQPQHPQQTPQQMINNPNNQQFNIVTLCKFGQESVQDIVSRFQEVFQTLRVSAPPNGTAQSTMEKKVQEQFRTIRLLFKRVRLLYDKCNDSCQQGIEYTHVESLIPFKEEVDNKPDPQPNEEYKKAKQENQELLETLKLKNKQLREVIERLRIIIWEINTMLNMRRS